MGVKRVLKLISGEVVFGDAEGVDSPNGTEILLSRPYQMISGKMIPYMQNIMGEPLQAIKINPINIIWSCPLDEFKKINSAYIEITTGLKI